MNNNEFLVEMEFLEMSSTEILDEIERRIKKIEYTIDYLSRRFILCQEYNHAADIRVIETKIKILDKVLWFLYDLKEGIENDK